MAQEYQWRADIHMERKPGADSELTYGALTQTDTDWQTASAGTVNIGTRQYFYHDSNTTYNGVYKDIISSRALYTITQYWTASFEAGNVLKIKINTIVNSAIRDQLSHPEDMNNTPGREITMFVNGATGYVSVLQYTDNKIAEAHALFPGQLPLTIPEQTITLNPGETMSGNSVMIHNKTIHAGDSWDTIFIGSTFYNPMPGEYRPGKVYNGVDDWLSHNRSGGASEVLKNTNWSVMTTIDGAVGTDNPPLIMDDNLDFHNMREIGTE